MDPTPAEPPGCLVILVPLSAAMADDVRIRLAHRDIDGEPDLRDLPKGVAVRFLADELIDALVNTFEAGYSVPLDVAVVGYHADDGAPRLRSLLSGDDPQQRFAAL